MSYTVVVATFYNLKNSFVDINNFLFGGLFTASSGW